MAPSPRTRRGLVHVPQAGGRKVLGEALERVAVRAPRCGRASCVVLQPALREVSAEFVATRAWAALRRPFGLAGVAESRELSDPALALQRRVVDRDAVATTALDDHANLSFIQASTSESRNARRPP